MKLLTALILIVLLYGAVGYLEAYQPLDEQQAKIIPLGDNR